MERSIRFRFFQNNLSDMKILGDAKKIDHDGKELTLEDGHFSLSIQVLNPTTFRVRSHPLNGSNFPETFALIGEPKPVHFEINDSENEIEIDTGSSKLIINKRPIRLRFFSADGTLISEDDPGLGMVWDESEVTNYRKLQSGERFFGLGEKTGPLDKAGIQYRNHNTDAYSYNRDSDPLYVSCPFFMGMAHERLYGIFFNNSSQTTFNFGAANDRFSFFRAERGPLDYFFFSGPTAASILENYTALTGRCSLPPLWSLGFQQCRYSYFPESEVKRIAHTFREKELPCDVIYLDIHYMDECKVFTWDGKKFPDPASMIEYLEKLGFKVVVILDPGIKVEEGYGAYEEGVERDIFIKYPDGQRFRGEAWPGWCHFPDFTSQKAREWWSRKVEEMTEFGVAGFWNDMNEPAMWGHHTPNLLPMNMNGDGGSMKEGRNVYGMQMSRATLEGAERGLNGRRTFNLTRAGFSGTQRYSAIWTGDNYANDEHLLLGARMINSMGLSGFAFTGNDIGGFAGNASGQLYVRWMAQAVFQPLMRAHTMVNSISSEPWSFGEENLAIVRSHLKLRYALLPHIYSLFRESTKNGMPPVRSMIFDYADEWKIFTEPFENQFLLGKDLLVCPMASEEIISKVYLPKGTWFHFFSDRVYEGGSEYLIETPLETIPVFVRGGGIIPVQSPTQTTQEPNDGVLRIHLYFGGEGNYTFYEDNGSTFDYQNGAYRETSFQLSGNKLSVKILHEDYKSGFEKIRLYLHGSKAEKALINNDVLKILKDELNILDAIPNFDPYQNRRSQEQVIREVGIVELDWKEKSFEMHFE